MTSGTALARTSTAGIFCRLQVAQGLYTFLDQKFKDLSRTFKGQLLKFQGPLFLFTSKNLSMEIV